MKKYLFLFTSLLFTFVSISQLGQVDLSFNTFDNPSYGDLSGIDNKVYTSAIQSDGKIILGGEFSSYNGISYNNIVRINPNGNIDSSFQIGYGFNSLVSKIKIQGDGKILVSGFFTSYNGNTVNRVVRLHTDGSIDSTFNVGVSNGGMVRAIDIDSNGDIYFGGDFTGFNGNSVNNIAKVNINGDFDNSFQVAADLYFLKGLLIQSNGKLIVYGDFEDYNSSGINSIVRLNQDGSLDNGFNIGLDVNQSVSTVFENSNSDLYIGGAFDSIAGNTNIQSLARFDSNGLLDPTFIMSPGISTPNVVLEHNNEVYIGGSAFPFQKRDLTGATIPGSSNGPNSILCHAFNGTDIYVAGTAGKRVYKLLFPDCSISPDFNNAALGGTTVLTQIETLPNGKMLIGASGELITTFNSIPTESPILRLMPDGSLDTTFIVDISFTQYVNVTNKGRFVVQQDGKILVLTHAIINGSPHRIIRLNSDGSLDSTFNLDNSIDVSYRYLNLCMQNDGKIILTTSYSSIQTQQIQNNLYRLNSDGSIDPSFYGGHIIPGTNVGRVVKILCASNGNIFIGRTSTEILALLPNGSINNDFSNIDLMVDVFQDMIFDAEENIIVGGNFSSVSQNIIRILCPTYSVDGSFINNVHSSNAMKLMRQNDNKIIAMYNNVNNNNFPAVYNNFVRRYNPDGSLDHDILFSDPVLSESFLPHFITMNQQNNILLAGGFKNINTSYLKNGVTRLFNDVPYDTCAFFNGLITVDSLINCASDGGISITGLNGAPPYSYNWTSGNLVDLNANSSQISSGGPYICEITDTNNCSVTIGTFIEGPSATGNTFDLNANLLSTEFRPGFDSEIWLNAFNDGCLPVDGQLKLVLDPQLTLNNSQPPAIVSGDTLIWDFSSLVYGSNHIKPHLNVHISTQAQIGDTVTLNLMMTPIVGDNDPSNNVKFYYTPIVNGYDPNVKSVYPKGKCLSNYIKQDQKLTYTIRFQNTGNSEAININIIDTFDINLDFNSLKIIGNSHDVVTEIIDNNIVNFVFNGINLIDSTTNEVESNGYVIFEIEPLPNVSHGTSISNHANIYFDFNPPIVTNKLINTIYDGDLSSLNCFLSLAEQEKIQKPLVYPNPFSNQIIVKSFYGLSQIILYSSIGQELIRVSSDNEGYGTLNTENLSNGVYLIKVVGQNTEEIVKIVKSK